jgi:hypothetical protein
MRWKALMYESDPNQEPAYHFNLKSRKSPPQHSDLANFENDLLKLIKNISFTNSQNNFQKQLKTDIAKIKSSNNVFVFADKSRNIYELNKASYQKIYTENITKTYKKSDIAQYNKINTDAKIIAKNLNIDDRLECLAMNKAFVTIKDHKDNFVNNPQCRLINPAKPELGKVSKVILDNINRNVRNATFVNQWHSTNQVINWFKSIPDKNICTFIQYDIDEFYPSISK